MQRKLEIALIVLRVFLVMFVVAFTVFVFSGAKAHANDSVYRLRPADLPESGGTGFLVEVNGEKLIVSNRHVCEITNSGVFIVERDGYKSAALVEMVSATDDLCILKPSKYFKGTPLRLGMHLAAPGSVVYSIGYPALANQTKSIGLLKAYEAQSSGYVPGAFITMGKTNFRAIPGMSGSPVFDWNNEVIGVIARLSIIDSHGALYVTGDRLKAFLATARPAPSIAKLLRLEALIASLKYGVDYRLIVAIMEVESSFNPLAIGADGEIGSMQLHPKYHSPKLGDIEHNVDTATRFLAYVKERFEPIYGDAYYVAYNYGPSIVLSNPRDTEYYKRVSRILGRE